MSGGTIAGAIGISTAALATGVSIVGGAIGVGSSVANIISGPGGSAGAGGAPSSGGGLSVTQQQYAYHGPHPGTEPLQGRQPPSSPVMQASKATAAPVATAAHSPTQAIGEGQAKQQFQDVWAGRLSKYLDYNTRTLG